MIEEAIFKLVDKKDLTYDEAHEVITEVMSGQTTPVQTAAFLAALSTKSAKAETADEIAGCASAMRELATKVDYDGEVLEIVGTGGDKSGSFNISTTAAFIAAAAGAKVAKHGNRAASSKSGTADVQEALGANISQDPEKAKAMLDEVGMCFFFAQDYHKAMKYVGPIRKELGIRTVFNILGPLTNPANPTYMLLGVYDESLVEPLARVLASLGVKRAMVVHGRAVLDELSTCCDTAVCCFDATGDGHCGGSDCDRASAGCQDASDKDTETSEMDETVFHSFVITPEEFGFPRCSMDDLAGGSAEENAAITRGILDGSITGPKRDTVLMNAGAALFVAGKAGSIEDGIRIAASLIDDGSALRTMEAYVKASNA